MSVFVLLTWLSSAITLFLTTLASHHLAMQDAAKLPPPGTLRVGDGDATTVARYLSQTSVTRVPPNVRTWAMRENRWPV